jgi:hypothetical protein
MPGHDGKQSQYRSAMTATPEVTREGVVTGPPGPVHKNFMDRIIDSIEWIAAFFVGIVALNTFTAVVMRKFFAVTIPDYYNFGQFLLGILIFWGIAATTSPSTWSGPTPRRNTSAGSTCSRRWCCCSW